MIAQPKNALQGRPVQSRTRSAVEGELGIRRPKLLFMITRAEHGGAQMHVLELARAMREDFDVHVATGEEGFLTEACAGLSIPAHVIPHLQREVNPVADARAWAETFRLFRELRPDIVHAHTWKSGMLGRSVAKALGIPSLYTVHMWPFGPGLPLLWRLLGPALERLAATWSRRLVTVSESAVEVGRRYRIAPPSRIVAIQNGIQDCPHRADLSARQVPVIGMVARFSPMKDHLTLLRAFALLDTPARLLLIGDGPARPAAEELARRLGIEDRVEFTGDRADVPSLLRKLDVFVLASRIELFPISILEAMRAGLPVVASRVGGIPEMVLPESTGLIVKPQSVEALSAALARVAKDRGLRIRFGRAGRLRYETYFHARSMCARTRSLYTEVLAEERRVAGAGAEFVQETARREIRSST